ncbi:MAG: hypothetical protein L6Q54_10275 [Leptospiraceae bacterium]|nr:hypothetical protein [Leptospiraceae bacterium]MCK6381613.1 hypothetical protein [Leptospiraceae bacterium]NUM41146.1 hypothetical protein [Leptospiraceae bacterium]
MEIQNVNILTNSYNLPVQSLPNVDIKVEKKEEVPVSSEQDLATQGQIVDIRA